MINKEGKLNLSTSGGSDLNQELVENSDYTKSTSESGMMNNDGVESPVTSKSDNKMTGESSSTPNNTSMMGETPEDDDHGKQEHKGGNSVGNDVNYKVSDMDSRMNVNAEKDNKKEGNSEPSIKENTLTKSDVPYDVPDDQTPRMSDMPKNIEKMTHKSAPDHSMEE